MPSDPNQAWRRLGELLIRRRLDLDPRFRNRQVFADERGVEYRIISDIERARRTNFHAVTIAEIERAYALPSGAIGRFLAGGDLESRPPLRPVAAEPVRLEMTPAMAAAVAPHVQEIQLRLELARRRYPGRELSGAMIFPTDPQSAATWDDVSSHGWPEPAVVQSVAVLRAWAQEEAEAGHKRTASG